MNEIEKRNPLKEKWYALGPPWCHSVLHGMTIISGSIDPHNAIPICDVQDYDEEHYSDDEAREIVAHIINLHNAALDSAPSPDAKSENVNHPAYSEFMRAWELHSTLRDEFETAERYFLRGHSWAKSEPSQVGGGGEVDRLKEALTKLIASYRITAEDYEVRSCYDEMMADIEFAQAALDGAMQTPFPTMIVDPDAGVFDNSSDD